MVSDRYINPGYLYTTNHYWLRIWDKNGAGECLSDQSYATLLRTAMSCLN